MVNELNVFVMKNDADSPRAAATPVSIQSR
jgi:hypothetical protein